MSEARDLPQGWIEAPLGSFTTIIGGSTPSRNESAYFGGDIPWLTPTEVPKNTVAIIVDTKEKLTELGYKSSSVRLIPQGSVLLTSRASIGYVAIAGIPLTTNQGFASFVVPEGFESRYLAWWLRSQKANLEERAPGTTFKEISKGMLRELVVPIPPLAEQRRIVAAIEEQFTRLDAGVAALKSARARLKQYRAAVLKAAVEGELTKAWREAHPDTEPASELLARILGGRRARWDAEQRAKGKGTAKLSYRAPEFPQNGHLPALPESWSWITIEQACTHIVDCLHSTAMFRQSGYLCVDTTCIRPGKIVFEKARYVDEGTFIERNRRMKPQENDVMFSREGTIGVTVRVPANIELCLGQRMMIFRLAGGVDAKFYENALNSEVFRSQYLGEIGGSTSPHLNIEDIRRFSIPLPPIEEQTEIVTDVERRLSVLAALEMSVESGLQRAERLRQSILTEAFAGQLVPQDPDDEPASDLLESIRADVPKPSRVLPHAATAAKR